MSSCIKLKQGFDLPLKGAAPAQASGFVTPAETAVCPDDFPGLTPKPAVKEGDKVKAGTPCSLTSSTRQCASQARWRALSRR